MNISYLINFLNKNKDKKIEFIIDGSLQGNFEFLCCDFIYKNDEIEIFDLNNKNKFIINVNRICLINNKKYISISLDNDIDIKIKGQN